MPKPRTADASTELLEPEAAAEQITAFFESLGEGAAALTVSIYQVDPKNRVRRSFLFALPGIGTLSGAELMAQVLAKYGAGEYLAEGRDAQGKIVSSPRFVVGQLTPVRPEIPDPRAAAPAPATSSASPELLAILQTQTRLLEALANPPARPSLREQLEEMRTFRDLFAPPPAPPSQELNLEKILGLVSGVFKLRDELTEGGGNDGGPLSVLARALAPALTKIAEHAVPAALPAPTVPAATDAQPGAAAPGGDVGAQNLMFKVYVSQLIQFAAAGLDPRAAADRVIKTLQGFPEPMVAAALDWLDDEEAVNNLVALDPAAEQYRAWLEQVVDIVLAVAAGDDPAAAALTVSPNGAAAAT